MKKPVAMRLSQEARDIAKEQSIRLGVSMTAVFEMSIRLLRGNENAFILPRASVDDKTNR